MDCTIALWKPYDLDTKSDLWSDGEKYKSLAQRVMAGLYIYWTKEKE